MAASEAHDSGLCAASAAVKRAFASDPLNLTLAGSYLNQHIKGAKDVAEWTPRLNACWFVATTLAVRRKYGLTIDETEARRAEEVLSLCGEEDTSLQIVECPPAPDASTSTSSADVADALAAWDDDDYGRITCAEARRHGIAPVSRGHPAYQYMHDGDGDGIVCE